MRRVLASERGSELYRKRQPKIEPAFAQVKFTRGLDRFRRRTARRGGLRHFWMPTRRYSAAAWLMTSATAAGMLCRNRLRLLRHEIGT